MEKNKESIIKNLETFGRTINIEPEVITLEEAMKRNYQVDENTQRGYVLTSVGSSLIILSTLLNFIYCTIAISSGKIQDGQQRFLSLIKFVNGDFCLSFKSKCKIVVAIKNILLKKIGDIDCLEGLYFDDLSEELKNRILNTKIIINDTKSDDEYTSRLLFTLINSNLNPLKTAEHYKANYNNPAWLEIIKFTKYEAEKHKEFEKILGNDSRLESSSFVASLIQLSLNDTTTGSFNDLSSNLLSSDKTIETIENEFELCSEIFDLISNNQDYLDLCKKMNGKTIAKNRFLALYWTILSDYKNTGDWEFLTMNTTARNLNNYVKKVFQEKKEIYNLTSRVNLDKLNKIRKDMESELSTMREYSGRKVITSVSKAPMKVGVL